VKIPKIGECSHCGNVGQLTEDHLPARNLFHESAPRDYITVPSCVDCNGGASMDDEYLRTVLIMKERAGSHPGAIALRSKVFRGLRRTDRLGLAKRILQGTAPVSVNTPAGIYLGDRLAFNVDLKRLRKVIARFTTGFFFNHTQMRLPSGYEVVVYDEDSVRDLSATDQAEFRKTIVAPTLNNRPISIGSGILRYWVAWCVDDPFVSSWIFEFFDDVRFVSATLPRGIAGSKSGTVSS